jgi:hypothetical protein
MAKNSKKGARVLARTASAPATTPMPPLDSGTGSVTIQQPGDGTTVTSSFSASGSGGPDNTSVTGILTDTITGNTFQSCPATAVIQLGSWTLTFQNIPPGTYILAVNGLDPNGGADAVTITIPPTTAGVLTIPAPTTTTTALTVITGTCDPSLIVSAVVTGSKPAKPGNVAKQGGGSFSFQFFGLAKGPHKVTVYPLKDRDKGMSQSFTVS